MPQPQPYDHQSLLIHWRPTDPPYPTTTHVSTPSQLGHTEVNIARINVGDGAGSIHAGDRAEMKRGECLKLATKCCYPTEPGIHWRNRFEELSPR